MILLWLLVINVQIKKDSTRSFVHCALGKIVQNVVLKGIEVHQQTAYPGTQFGKLRSPTETSNQRRSLRVGGLVSPPTGSTRERQLQKSDSQEIY